MKAQKIFRVDETNREMILELQCKELPRKKVFHQRLVIPVLRVWNNHGYVARFNSIASKKFSLRKFRFLEPRVYSVGDKLMIGLTPHHQRQSSNSIPIEIYTRNGEVSQVLFRMTNLVYRHLLEVGRDMYFEVDTVNNEIVVGPFERRKVRIFMK